MYRKNRLFGYLSNYAFFPCHTAKFPKFFWIFVFVHKYFMGLKIQNTINVTTFFVIKLSDLGNEMIYKNAAFENFDIRITMKKDN